VRFIENIIPILKLRVFIYGLFNDDASISGFLAAGRRMISHNEPDIIMTVVLD
jgi:hypothetical protein